jgi:1,4-alpha-glucan branching enzyme
MSDAFDRLRALRHPDPHSVLGAHPVTGGVLVRASRPEATAMAVLREGAPPAAMRGLGGGLFEATLPAASLPLRYRLEARYGDRAFQFDDPYAFLPTLGPLDLHLLNEGRHARLWEKLGAHPRTLEGIAGTAFAVWAPNAEGVSVVGDFNGWDGRLHAMRRLGSSGVWELFLPDVGEGALYKYELRARDFGPPILKADPFAFRTELPPATASVVHGLGGFAWTDAQWLERKKGQLQPDRPLSIYEVHSASFARLAGDEAQTLSWAELAHRLADHVERLGFTHVELLPIAEHPFGGSWGYQVGAFYAPTARHGHPDGFRAFVDTLHARGLGVLVDWVPGHFPRDAFALGQFDGTALYEHADPREGAHPDWGTLIFNYGRHEVRNFLVANALFWLEEYHLDGLRVDAVASMLYRDYSRAEGQWVPNRHGGRENEEAIAFLREVNTAVQQHHPGSLMIAEESTSWPRVSGPVDEGGLGFTHKWNMGWMHDTLHYFAVDPVYRRFHHNQLTFGTLYAWSERFVLPLSHDEVVHGKGSLLNKMSGDAWQKFANLRALYAWMWAYPGKKLLFMGNELAPWKEWSTVEGVDFGLLAYAPHRGMEALVCQLNAHLRRERALFANDFDAAGLTWLQADAADANVYAFLRNGGPEARAVLVVANLAPVVRSWRVGVPEGTQLHWRVLLNTDSREFGGSGVGNPGTLEVVAEPWDNQPRCLSLTLPPLAVLYLVPQEPAQVLTKPGAVL